LGREQLSNFDPRPFGEALEEEFRIARMQFETRDQTPARAVRFAQRSAFATATCNLSKTSIVGSHKTKDWADPHTGKWRNQQRILARFKRPGCYAQIVKTKIEDQSSAHENNANHNRSDGGKRFVVRADELLTAFLELESAIRTAETLREPRFARVRVSGNNGKLAYLFSATASPMILAATGQATVNPKKGPKSCIAARPVTYRSRRFV
jgi:hypothetical protein